MTTKKLLNQLPDSELEDFIASCEKRRLSHDEFEVRMEEEYQTIGVGSIRREATVVRLSSGKHKRYPAGNGEAWTIAFEEDLLHGYFE